MNKRALSDDYRALKSNLRLNCKDCSGLCCVALFFNKSDGFPENKKAGKPCINLNNDYTCNVYNQLESKHLKGCIAYDCFGAGQKVTQEWKSKGYWNTNNLIKNDIFKSFEMNQMLNQIMWYLLEAYTICDESKMNRINQLIQENINTTKLDMVELLTYDIETYRTKVNVELKQLTYELEKKSNKKIESKFQFEMDYSNQDLSYMDFTMTYLIGSNLDGCKLQYTNFLGTDVRDVSVKNTDLSECIFLTQFQVNSMLGNVRTLLPSELSIPIHWTYID